MNSGSQESWTDAYPGTRRVPRAPPPEPGLESGGIDELAALDSGGPGHLGGFRPNVTGRRFLSALVILFVGAAFVVLTVTGTRGPAFTGLVLAAVFLLLLIVAYLAFAGERDPAAQTTIEDFGSRDRTDGGESARAASAAWEGMDGAIGRLKMPESRKDSGETPVHAFVQSIVAAPPLPATPMTPGVQRAALEALRKEARGLLGMAKVTGVNVEPYRAYLLDARRAAEGGNMEGSLRSIRLANELLRGAIEKSLLKHQRQVEAADDGSG